MLDLYSVYLVYYVIETIFNKTKTMLWEWMFDVSLYSQTHEREL